MRGGESRPVEQPLAKEDLTPGSSAGARPPSRRTRLVRAVRLGVAVPVVSLVIAACGGATAAAPTVASTVATAASSTAVATRSGQTGTSARVTVTPINLSQTVASYKIDLRIDPPTRIYTQAQVQQLKPAAGEILISGQMVNFRGTPVAGGSGFGVPGATPGVPFRRFGSGTPGTGFRRFANGTPVAGAGRGAFAGVVHDLSLYVVDASSGQPVKNATVTISVTDNTANTPSQTLTVDTLEAVGKGASDLHYGSIVMMPPNRSYTVTVAVNGTPATFSFLLH